MRTRLRLKVTPRGQLPLAGSATIAAGIGLWAGCTPPIFAQDVPGLPVKKVQLFTSGVAYVERSGPLTGNQQIPLSFRTAQINDILKSMVLIDEGGRVQPATFGTRDPISRSLKAFAVDVSDNVTIETLLGRLRGKQVEILQGDRSLGKGAIAGIEKRQVPAGEATVLETTVNLLTEQGLTAIALGTGRTIRVLDPALDQDFRRALALLASSSDEGKRQVLLHFEGAGKRNVRVGYVTEAPVWKISYRLLLGSNAAAGKPYLQGWALVENSTDEDWNGVELSLVSGRPVSFTQDLYQPLYVPRPVVGPDIAASPLPQTHDGSIETDRAVALRDVNGQIAMKRKPAEAGANGPAGPSGSLDEDAAKRYKTEKAPAGGQPGFNPTGTDMYYAGGGRTGGEASPQKQIAQVSAAIIAAASGRKTGELFSYSLKQPLNLPRQQAAMIPVIAGGIEADKISLYNPESDPKFALNGLRVHNSTGVHLKGGPITLFDGATYAGDAVMDDVPPGDTRIITYAVDQAIVCNHEVPRDESKNVSIQAHAGVIITKIKEVTETLYTFKSNSDKPRTMVVEQARSEEDVLSEPAKPLEKTSNLYRFQVTVPARKTAALKVVTVQNTSQQVNVSETNSEQLYEFFQQKTISAKLKSALQTLIVKRRKMNDLQASAANRKAEIASISADQERIRKNMGALDHGSPLYKRYTAELDAQETKINSLRSDYERLTNLATAAQRDARAYADNISE